MRLARLPDSKTGPMCPRNCTYSLHYDVSNLASIPKLTSHIELFYSVVIPLAHDRTFCAKEINFDFAYRYQASLLFHSLYSLRKYSLNFRIAILIGI